jgi:general secretion pathway protein J
MTGARGFTLLELMVAVAVFAVFSLLAFGGLTNVIRQSEFMADAEARLTSLQFAIRRITTDLYQLQPRPVRDTLGTAYRPALIAGVQGEFPLEFTRGGWSNTLGGPRGNLQRVAYLNDNGTLVRLHWLVLERTLSSQPVRTELLDGVEQMTVTFLDETQQWQTEWPPLAAGDGQLLSAEYARPLAVELSLVLEGWGTIRRVIELSP